MHEWPVPNLEPKKKKKNPIKTGSIKHRFPEVRKREESEVLSYPVK